MRRTKGWGGDGGVEVVGLFPVSASNPLHDDKPSKAVRVAAQIKGVGGRLMAIPLR